MSKTSNAAQRMFRAGATRAQVAAALPELATKRQLLCYYERAAREPRFRFVRFRLGIEDLDRIDEWAQYRDLTREEAVVRLLLAALGAEK